MPSAEDCVLGNILRRRAHEDPERSFAVFEDGREWSYRQAWYAANETARQLQERGVRHGDRVLSWLPNGRQALRTWFGANLLGAVYVPLNTAYRGRIPQHAITLAEAKVFVVHRALAARLEGVDLSAIDHVVTVDDADPIPARVEPVSPDRPVMPWDNYGIIMTSGTTGLSKGVACSYVQLAVSVVVIFDGILGPGDRYFVSLPLFHNAGTIGTFGALLHGASLCVVETFETTRFWSLIRRTGTTHATLLGVMASFLAKQPPSSADRDHPLRHTFMVPLIDDLPGFSERFGVTVLTLYNMTETADPIVSGPNPTVVGTCGRLRRGVEAKLVDEHDVEVPTGAVGEFVVRSSRPWELCSGYWDAPEATARAWRNGWFHTGDTLRKNNDGDYFFVDRTKDAIRRRGENISSLEVEAEALRRLCPRSGRGGGSERRRRGRGASRRVARGRPDDRA